MLLLIILVSKVVAAFCSGTRRDQQRAFFIGGSPELEDMVEVIQPKGFSGKALNKYGFKTEASGLVKVGLILEH